MPPSQFTTFLGAPTILSAAPVPIAVDPLFQAARVALRPLDYTGVGQILGHYRVGVKTGAIAATLSAASGLLSYRWAPGNGTFAVLLRIEAAVVVDSTVTTGVPMDIAAWNARSFSVQAAANGAAVAFTAQSQKNRSTMSQSLASIYYASSTTAITEGTQTLDGAPFANAPFNPPTNTVAGSASALVDLYSVKTFGQHPEVYQSNEGFVLQNIAAGPATGTISYYINVEWAEVVLF